VRPLSDIDDNVADAAVLRRRNEGWLDLRDEAHRLFDKKRYEQVVFGERYGATRTFGNQNLKDSEFVSVRFAQCMFDLTNFRNSVFYDCDFRYARFTQVSFEECWFAECDFYRAVFVEANSFIRAQLVHTSFDEAWLAGVLGLDRSTFAHSLTWRRHRTTPDRHTNQDRLRRIETYKRNDPIQGKLPKEPDEPESFQSAVDGSYRPALWPQKLRFPQPLRWLAVSRWLGVYPGRPAALTQEAPTLSYYYFLRRKASDRPDYYGPVAGVRKAALQASNTYRSFAGLWSSQGQFDDSSFAYVRSKILERRQLSPWRLLRKYPGEHDESRKGGEDAYHWWMLFSWLWLCAAGGIAKFGEGILRVFLSFLILVIVVPGVVYTISGSVVEHHHSGISLWQGILFSLFQVTSHTSQTLSGRGTWVDVLGTVQVLLGVVVIGLLGFVLGNRLRSS
jgi:pentapeptide repeat protein